MVYPVPAVLLAPMATTCAWARFAASRATSGKPSSAKRRRRCRRLIEHPPFLARPRPIHPNHERQRPTRAVPCVSPFGRGLHSTTLFPWKASSCVSCVAADLAANVLVGSFASFRPYVRRFVLLST